MDATGSLQLLFDQPAHEVWDRLETYLQTRADLFVDTMTGPSNRSATVRKDGLCFTINSLDHTRALSGCRAIFIALDGLSFLSALSISLSPHVEGGSRIPEIAKAYLVFCAELSRYFAPKTVVWNPGKLASDPAYFADSVLDYAAGGAFPVLTTIGFDFAENELSLNSSGLDWFCGQEIQLSGNGVVGQDLMLRAVRLAHDLALNGAVALKQNVTDIDEDRIIALTPQKDGNVLMCEIQSKMDQKTQLSALH